LSYTRVGLSVRQVPTCCRASAFTKLQAYDLMIQARHVLRRLTSWCQQ